MSVVVVDWLGRGGIAQTAAAWAQELEAADRRVTIVSRPGLELGLGGALEITGSPVTRNPLVTHLGLIRKAAMVIRRDTPEVVVVQNYLIPPLERQLYRAVREAGSKLIVVIHDHRLHSVLAGTRAGLRAALHQADHVVVHSRYVARGVEAFAHVIPEVIPLPVITATIDHPAEPPPAGVRGEEPLALHFGVVKRRYKGLSTIVQLAATHPPGWRIGVAGAGAPAHVDGAFTLPGFIPPETLVAVIRASAATLLPYRYATQSGAVALAQVLGSVPVVPAVGGLSEQVDDDRNGLVVPRGGSIATWAAALRRLKDPVRRREMSMLAQAQRLGDHRRFRAAILELTGSTMSEAIRTASDERIERLAGLLQHD